MASTFAVTRNHLIFGVCLPFAVLLGYLLADVDDPVSKLVIAAAITCLGFPLLMKWYHPLLVVSWNMTAQATFLPGAPSLWSFFAVLGVFFAVLNRSVNPENKFAHVPSLTLPILVLSGVIVVTAAMTGGIALQMFGSDTSGGKSYYYILSAIIGFFALSSKVIPPKSAPLYVTMFFLSGLAATINILALRIGPSVSFIFRLFPSDMSGDAFGSVQNNAFGEIRLGGMMVASFALFAWMLARYGVRGVFDLTKPWRLALFTAGILMGFLGGFRTHLILVTMTFGTLFIIEGLWRTKIMVIVVMMVTLMGILLVTFADKLPSTIQRTVSFLPIGIDPVVKAQAESSTEWRIEIWRQVVSEVPIYLFRGKGFNYSGNDVYMAQFNMRHFGSAASSEWAAISGDYHNGPLSLLIPFGIYGLLGFMWLLAAGVLYLYKNYRYGLPELKTINAFLFAYFVAKAIFFFSIFGSITFELYVFTGILGLSIALNTPKTTEPAPEGELALQT